MLKTHRGKSAVIEGEKRREGEFFAGKADDRQGTRQTKIKKGPDCLSRKMGDAGHLEE